MPRFRLTVEYDGTDFAGFQLQSPDLRTVQGVLEAAIRKCAGAVSRVHCAGRTDAGVHATGQVIHFDTEWRIPEGLICRVLNHSLPRDVRAKDAQVVDERFHARFSATGRTYRYAILNREAAGALLERFAWHVHEPLDLNAMRGAAAHLTGIHDWAAFGQPDMPHKSSVRRIEAITITPRPPVIYLTVRGNAFLRHQVRAFVGTLFRVGIGRLAPDAVAQIRDGRDRARCPAVAPAWGLTLTRVHYDGVRVTGEPPWQVWQSDGEDEDGE